MIKKEKWDGRSRIPTKQYKENYDRIFKNGTTKEADRSADEVCLRTDNERRQKDSD
jgi:hypothetical protein